MHPDKIKAITHNMIRCRFQVCKVETVSGAFLNYEHQKKSDPLLVIKDLVAVYINCPD